MISKFCFIRSIQRKSCFDPSVEDHIAWVTTLHIINKTNGKVFHHLCEKHMRKRLLNRIENVEDSKH